MNRIKPIYLILFIGFIARIITALYLGNSVSGLSGAHDEISYSLLGQRFADGFGLTFPSGWYPWIKPDTPQSYYSVTISIFLGVIYKIFGYKPIIARIIFATLSTVNIYMLYVLTKHLFRESVALIASIIVSLYAYLIFYGVTLVTETPFILFLLVSIIMAYEICIDSQLWKWVVLGIVLSVCMLLRMAVVFFIPFLLGWLILKKRENLRNVFIPIIVLVISLIPFVIRNYNLWNRFLLLEAQFGHVFWNGNHPDHNGTFSNEVFEIPAEILETDNDVLITNQLLRLGVQNVINDPLHFIRLTISRLSIFFTFWPTADTNMLGNIGRVTSFGIMLPFMVVGVWLSRSYWRTLIPIYLFILIHVATYAFSWTMIRYRMPIDMLLIPFGAYTIRKVYEKISFLRIHNR